MSEQTHLTTRRVGLVTLVHANGEWSNKATGSFMGRSFAEARNAAESASRLMAIEKSKGKNGGARPGAGRKPGEPAMAVKIPIRIIQAATQEKARRRALGKSAYVTEILAQWCDAGRNLSPL